MNLTVTASLAPLGGVAHIQDLLRLGYTRHRVAAMTHAGDLLRPRIGWYALPTLEPDAVRAVRVGGRLGCVSAARSYGLPVPEDARLHVTLHTHATRLRSSEDPSHRVHAGQERGVVWHRTVDGLGTGAERFRVPLPTLLDEVRQCFGMEWAVGALDAARHLGRLNARDVRALEQRAELSEIVALSEAGAESVLESVLRVRLGLAGLRPASQVQIGQYRVDFLLDGWLVLECDGSAHGDAEQFAWDRRRDAFLNASGYRVLRFTYRQVVHDWPATLHTIRAVHRQGRPETPLG